MSIWCGAGRERIEGSFSLVYLLGTNKKGLTFPDKKKDIVPPNSAVCTGHLKQVPDTEFKDSPKSIRGRIYGVAVGSGNPLFEGSKAISLMGISSDNDFRYLTRAAMEKYLPKALEIIIEYSH